MPLTQDQIQSLLPEIMAYEPDDITIEDFEKISDTRIKAGITIEGAPRDESEFFAEGDSDFTLSFVGGYSYSDNAPAETSMRAGILIEKEDMYENALLEDLPYDSLSVMIAGNMSTPEYCDDESDGYFSGTLYVEVGPGKWAEEESRKECIKEVEKAINDLLGAAVSQVKALREMGHDKVVAKQSLNDLVRGCLKAA